MTVLHDPFKISARLLPGLKIGDGWLSLECLWDARVRFHLDTPEFEYTGDTLRCGALGWESHVEVFETMLSFMEAGAEATRYPGSDNADMFPSHVMQWLGDNASDVSEARTSICDFEGEAMHGLIED